KSGVTFLVVALVAIATLISFIAWCLSDSGLQKLQPVLVKNYGILTHHSLTLFYGDAWIVENVSRPDDGAVLAYGLWKTDQKIATESASLVLKRPNTGERVSVVITSMPQ